MVNNKIHFAGLDGLRFISISFVVLHHLDTFKNYYGLGTFNFPVIGLIGYYGIQFFFAGSGFLITYLLLREFDRNKKISLPYFYLRRILRIWPAYYLLIFFALVVVLHTSFFNIPEVTDSYLAGNYRKGNLLYFFFLPHIAPYYCPTTPFVHQTYTIGIEEQFYFIWGIMFFFIASRVRGIFLLILISVPVLNFFHDYFYDSSVHGSESPFVRFFFQAATYARYCRFSTFAIGSLFAIAFFKKAAWLNYFKPVAVQLAVYAVLVASIAFDFSIPYLRDEYIATLMLCVFSIATFPGDSIIKYDAKWLSYLGRISYGIYLFHIFAIIFAIKLCIHVFHFHVNNYAELGILCLVTMLFAITLGWISYNGYEKYFLRLKKRFAKV